MIHYVSDVDGVGGRLRETDERFRVRELERFETEPLAASPDAYPHVVFRATLEGWDTNDFAARLSDALGISRERVSWAGTKDKYAVTTQLFSIDRIEPDALPDVDGAELEVLGRAGRSLEFGDLAGNAFELVVTDPERPANAPAITNALAAFGGRSDDEADDENAGDGATSIGVPNYFGQQRFGSRRPVTHEVGLEIVRGDWEGAVLAYLGNPTDAEPEGTREARAFVDRELGRNADPASDEHRDSGERSEPRAEPRNWQAALERFPHRLRYERSMLHELADREGELGPEAFRAALERVPSNLQRLFVHAAQSYAFNLMLGERLERGLPFDRPVAGDVVCFADTDAPEGLELPDTDRLQRVDERRVDSVTRHCERGRAFVTAPLVGTETELADGDQGDLERDVLDDLGLEPGDFDLPGEFHSTGTRRAILLRTGIDRETDPLRLSFALPKGSYATVVAREYLKVDPVDLG